jgi:hypothetical protein
MLSSELSACTVSFSLRQADATFHQAMPQILQSISVYDEKVPSANRRECARTVCCIPLPDATIVITSTAWP